MKGRLPWESAAHAALSLAAGLEGNVSLAANEARESLDVEGETHLLYYVPILWAAAKALIVTGQEEAASLSAEILGGLAFLASSMSESESKTKWFESPVIRELSEIVGFDPTSGESGEGTPELTEADLDLLRELASGVVGARAGKSGQGDSDRVVSLLTKLGVETENEAIQYAIRSGVTWQ
jgi:hypothetical protein